MIEKLKTYDKKSDLARITGIAAKEGESLEGFDLTVIYCLGCSWSGSPRRTVRY